VQVAKEGDVRDLAIKLGMTGDPDHLKVVIGIEIDDAAHDLVTESGVKMHLVQEVAIAAGKILQDRAVETDVAKKLRVLAAETDVAKKLHVLAAGIVVEKIILVLEAEIAVAKIHHVLVAGISSVRVRGLVVGVLQVLQQKMTVTRPTTIIATTF
jgi:hypothetical protein